MQTEWQAANEKPFTSLTCHILSYILSEEQEGEKVSEAVARARVLAAWHAPRPI